MDLWDWRSQRFQSLGCELSRHQPHLFMCSPSSGEALKDTAWSVRPSQAGRCWPENQVKSVVHLRCQRRRLWAERPPYLSLWRAGVRMKSGCLLTPPNAGDSCVTLWALRRRDTSDFQNLSYWMAEGYGNHVRSHFCVCLVERERLGYLRESGNPKLTERQGIILHGGQGGGIPEDNVKKIKQKISVVCDWVQIMWSDSSTCWGCLRFWIFMLSWKKMGHKQNSQVNDVLNYMGMLFFFFPKKIRENRENSETAFVGYRNRIEILHRVVVVTFLTKVTYGTLVRKMTEWVMWLVTWKQSLLGKVSNA